MDSIGNFDLQLGGAIYNAGREGKPIVYGQTKNKSVICIN